MRTVNTQGSRQDNSLPADAGAFVILGFLWAVSLAVLASPLAATLPIKFFFLSVPAGLSMLVTFKRPQLGFRVWAVGLALLATQTGFQLDIGAVRTSALEVGIVALLLVLLYVQRHDERLGRLQLPGQRLLVLFAAYAAIMLVISLILGTGLDRALFQFKGFVLYPLMAYVLVAGLRERQALHGLALILAAWYSIVAAAAVVEFVAQGGSELVFRANAGYAPKNIFGVTLISVALFVLGIEQHNDSRRQRLLAYATVLLLVAGGITSLSRTAALAFPAGALFLLLAGRRQRAQLLLFVAVTALILLAWLPESALEGRLIQLTDSSTGRRTGYLLSGLHAWKARWLTGWGWGQAFKYTGASAWTLADVWRSVLQERGPLVPTREIPWYHNDYLNLAVQAGLIGVVLYLAFWQQVLAAARGWLARFQQSPTSGYVLGAAAALLALLVGGLFEHVLWRPDSAGLVGLWLGILCAAMRVGSRESENA